MDGEVILPNGIQVVRGSLAADRRSIFVVYCVDLLAAQLAMLLGFVVCYGGVAEAPKLYVDNWQEYALCYELIVIAVLFALQPQGCNWRHAGIRDLGSATAASILSSGTGILLGLILCYRLPGPVCAWAMIFQLALAVLARSALMTWSNIDPAAEPLYIFFKRILDVVISACALTVLSPLFLAVAVAIKLDDGGPIIYTSTRVGEKGRQFQFYKFRSMYVDADKHLNKVMHLNEMDGPVFKIKDDPRITKVGRFLRKSSLDELPQLWNILRGDMSIVGPRPPLPGEVMEYGDYERQRLNVPGGLTCYWQCSGRSEIGFDDWMRLDVQYIADRGIWTDIKLIFRTVGAVLSGKGAE